MPYSSFGFILKRVWFFPKLFLKYIHIYIYLFSFYFRALDLVAHLKSIFFYVTWKFDQNGRLKTQNKFNKSRYINI